MLLQKKKAKKAISKVAGERREREIWENVQEEESQWNNKNALDNMIDQRWTNEGRKKERKEKKNASKTSQWKSLLLSTGKKKQEKERESCASEKKCQWCSGVMKWIRQESRGGGKRRTRRPGALVQQQQQQSSVSCTEQCSAVQCSGAWELLLSIGPKPQKASCPINLQWSRERKKRN